MKLEELRDANGFVAHCEVLLTLLKMKRNEFNSPAIKHHIRSAIREASKHVTKSPQKKAQYISKRARILRSKATKQKPLAKGSIIFEHVVPISVLNDAILKMKNPTCKSIRTFLLKYSVTAYITNDENSRLKNLGLSEDMPKGASISNTFARYDKAKITYAAYSAV